MIPHIYNTNHFIIGTLIIMTHYVIIVAPYIYRFIILTPSYQDCYACSS